MPSRTRLTAVIAGVAGASALMFTVAYSTWDSDSQDDPGPLSGGAAERATEAARPTPTSIPPVAVCPADAAVCEVATDMLDASRRGDLTAMMARARAVLRQCPPTPDPAMQPLCEAGGEKSGFFTGAKNFSFVSATDFAEFVRTTIPPGRQPVPIELGAIACAGDAQNRDCSEFFAVSYRIERAPTSVVALVLLFTRDDGGEPQLIGARQEVPGGPELRGGPAYIGQTGVPFKGNIYYVPWKP